ncbi:MAG: CRISPR-associated endonuclease Cas2 [bacterium]|nr:CRISPR-associated endonuclease Cas2 [bacterium]
MEGKEVLKIVAEELFDMAKNLGELATEIVFTPYGKLRIHGIPRTTYYRKLKKFQKNGLVRKVRKSYGTDFVVTEKARQLRRNPRVKLNRTDGMSTIIMFDIPENKHKERDNFRRYLLKNGYTQIQKSVFISPFKRTDELRGFAEELKIEKNVFLISGKIDQF